MSDEYKCPVCKDTYTEQFITSVQCEECGMRVCVHCVGVTTTGDICDHCSEKISDVKLLKSEYDVAEEFVETLTENNFTYEQMNQAFQIVRNRYRNNKLVRDYKRNKQLKPV